MNRRKLFGMLAGAAAALAIPKLPPLPAPNRIKNYVSGVDVSFMSNPLHLDAFEERILAPALEKLAKQIDEDIMRTTGYFSA